MGTGELELTTETVTVGHPEAAEVEVVGGSPGVSLLTRGTLLVRLHPGRLTLALKVEGSFVTVDAPVSDAITVTRAVARALPKGLHLTTTLDGRTLMLCVVRDAETARAVRVEAVCTDRSLHVRQVADNRLVLTGAARGGSRLSLNVASLEVSLALSHRETPVQVALRLRSVLEARFTVLLTVPARRDGDVSVTLLHRR